MDETRPHIDSRAGADGRLLVLVGSWSAAALAQPDAWQGLSRAFDALTPQERAQAQWDLRSLDRMDHTGAQVLWNAWSRQWPQQLQTLPAQRAMLERVARFSVAQPVAAALTPTQRFLRLGEIVYQVVDHARDLLALIGQLLLDFGRLLRAPRLGPWRDVSGQLYRIGATAMPITALVGFLIGVVLAYLMSQQLRKFGADAFIVDVLGIALIRELAPVLAAILIAGRSGSSITA